MAAGERPPRVLSTTLLAVDAPASLVGGAVESQDEVLFVRYGFSLYEIAARRCGAKPVEAPDADYGTDVAAQAEVASNEELVIIDGYEGTIIVNPTPALVQEYASKVSRHEEYEKKLLENRDLKAITKDGRSTTASSVICHDSTPSGIIVSDARRDATPAWAR